MRTISLDDHPWVRTCGQICGWVAVVAALAASWLVTLETQSSFHDFKSAVYGRCLVRATYDQNQLNIDRAIQSYYQDLQVNIAANAKDDAFYQQLQIKVAAVLSTLDTSITRGVPPRAGCVFYKP